jgi:hypothetical protein
MSMLRGWAKGSGAASAAEPAMDGNPASAAMPAKTWLVERAA